MTLAIDATNSRGGPHAYEADAGHIAILLLDDSPGDAELVLNHLRRDGIECTYARVERREDFVRALDQASENGGLDLILSDVFLTSFDGLEALEITKAKMPDVPFIFISDGIGEELAIDTLRRGATDYVLKNRLDRLSSAVRRARKEVLERIARKRAEEERDALLVREREARREAESANRMKDEFLAVVSHELRTPLNAMLGWIQLLRSGTVPKERQDRALQTIERNAKAQAKLVDDLLDLSRIITGKLRIETRPFEVAIVVEAALDAVRPSAKAKNIMLEVEVDPVIPLLYGDSSRMQQVVWNLVANAIKFTPSSGRVKISVKAHEEELEICVSDTGEGIDPSFLPYVFERFRQAEGVMERKHGGLGLGLSIVRHVVELHGGRVTVESSGKNQGATFRVKLPLPERPFPPPSGKAHAFVVSGDRPTATQLEGLRVLLVEDEADTRDLLVTMLQQYGASVTATSSAAEALEKLSGFTPDVLISDIAMPVVDGYTLIRKIRELHGDREAQIPAIALTAYARSEDSKSALQAGFQLHIPKPVEPDYLAAVLAKLTKKNGD